MYNYYVRGYLSSTVSTTLIITTIEILYVSIHSAIADTTV